MLLPEASVWLKLKIGTQCVQVSTAKVQVIEQNKC